MGATAIPMGPCEISTLELDSLSQGSCGMLVRCRTVRNAIYMEIGQFRCNFGELCEALSPVMGPTKGVGRCLIFY